MKDFLEAIDRSYNNYEEQLNMSQRAMKISSDELYHANQKLREEARSQKSIIDNLMKAVRNLKIKSPENTDENLHLDELAGYLEEQSREIQKVNSEREKLLKNLENRNQVLSDYAHMVSHDLKSPLRSINSLVNWIIEENQQVITSSCGGHFELILKNLEKMDALISGILKYSTIDEDETELYENDVNYLVNDILDSIYKPGHVHIYIKDQLPVVKGDKYRLEQLFRNLIENAIKSIDKEKGLIEIGVNDNNEAWEFYIRDNGKGIPSRYHKKVFEIFQKIEDNQMTSGIGLSIVKKIVDFYGGEIWLKSQEGKETTFYFTLPK